jgi:hypothetical protein
MYLRLPEFQRHPAVNNSLRHIMIVDHTGSGDGSKGTKRKGRSQRKARREKKEKRGPLVEL